MKFSPMVRTSEVELFSAVLLVIEMPSEASSPPAGGVAAVVEASEVIGAILGPRRSINKSRLKHPGMESVNETERRKRPFQLFSSYLRQSHISIGRFYLI